MEDNTGKLVQNEYVYPNFEIGVVPSATTIQQWADLLRSNDKADVLSALVFLGGRHLAEDRRRLAPEPHKSQYARLFQELIGDSTLHELIENLRKSNNEWISQAADLAARGPRERPLF